MFQYAFGRAVSMRTSTILELDEDLGFKNDCYGRSMALMDFSLKTQPMSLRRTPLLRVAYTHSRLLRVCGLARFLRNWSDLQVYHEKTRFGYDENVFRVPSPSYFLGYWQNPRYFEPLASELRRELVLRKPNLGDRWGAVLAEIESTNSVGVHIRRYDKADLKLYGRVRTDQRTLDYSYY